MQGDELSPGIRKIRLAIVSKGKGKSGGARVITYTICASESEEMCIRDRKVVFILWMSMISQTSLP